MTKIVKVLLNISSGCHPNTKIHYKADKLALEKCKLPKNTLVKYNLFPFIYYTFVQSIENYKYPTFKKTDPVSIFLWH